MSDEFLPPDDIPPTDPSQPPGGMPGDEDEGPAAPTATVNDLARLFDVNLEFTVQLGHRRMRIADVLSLKPGSVVEFQKAADEPLDILVNDHLIARGEAVVIGERYGIRITEVVSPNERLANSGIVKELSA